MPFNASERDRMEYQPFLGEEAEESVNLDNYTLTPELTRRSRAKRRRLLVIAMICSAALLTLTLVGIIYAANESSASDTPVPVDGGEAAGSGGGVEPSPVLPQLKPSDKEYWFESAAVATDSTECSEVGKQLLLKGGNAVDAAIGGLLCSGLTDPQSMGIGGGFFMTIYNRTTGLSTVIDARETAPGNATEDMFGGDPSLAARGPLSIAVPAEIQGYWYTHQKYGHLPWSDLFEKTIELARDGFHVTVALHHAIQDDKDLLSTEPTLKEVFFNKETGQVFRYNEMMRRPKLAKTLQKVADGGIKAFLTGSLMDDIAADLNDIGAIVTKEDIQNYQVKEKTPIEITLGDSIKVFSPPPPSSGAVLSFMLNILEGYKFSSKDLETTEDKVLTYHRTAEAFKFAYAKRTALGDEDFVDVKELVQNLTSKSFADSIRAMISDNMTHNYQYYGPNFYTPQKNGTSHLSALDSDGNAVSVTSTINGRFGAHLRGLRTGIIWNNEMDDFSAPNITNEYGLRPSAANFVAAGKRPLSSMCPAVVVQSTATGEDRVRLVIGAAGGSFITSAVAWITEHNLWLGENIKSAVDNYRIHHQLLPDTLRYELGLEKPVVDGLRLKGHNMTSFKQGKSIAQGIQVLPDGRILGASDYRKGGTPAGF